MAVSATGEARRSGALPARESLFLLTVVAAAAYFALHRLPLPGVVHLRGWALIGRPAVGPNLLDLSWRPFFTGFLLTELAAFLLPPLRRLRHGGLAGRRKLTGFAVQVGVGVALVQSASLAHVLEVLSDLEGTPLPAVPIPTLRLLVVVSLVAGSCLVYVAGRFLRGRMVVDGFVLFLLVDGVLVRAPAIPAAWQQLSNAAAGKVLLAVLVVVVPAVLAGEVLRRRRPIGLPGPGGETVPFEVPIFPQGIWPVFAFPAAAAVGSWVYSASGGRLGWLWRPALLGAFLLHALLLLVAFSWLGFLLFSSRRRLAANLPFHIELPDGIEDDLVRLHGAGLVILVVGTVGFRAARLYGGLELFAPLGFTALVAAAVGAYEMVAKWRFRGRHPEVAPLAELDNVHLASYLRGLLAAHGIECLVESWHFRGLCFFLGPLFKMRLVVPRANAERALELLRLDEIEIA